MFDWAFGFSGGDRRVRARARPRVSKHSLNVLYVVEFGSTRPPRWSSRGRSPVDEGVVLARHFCRLAVRVRVVREVGGVAGPPTRARHARSTYPIWGMKGTGSRFWPSLNQSRVLNQRWFFTSLGPLRRQPYRLVTSATSRCFTRLFASLSTKIAPRLGSRSGLSGGRALPKKGSKRGPARESESHAYTLCVIGSGAAGAASPSYEWNVFLIVQAGSPARGRRV